MTNHPNRSRRTHSVYIVAEVGDCVSSTMIASELTRKEAFDLAKKTAGRGAEFTKYGSCAGRTSVAYVGDDVTAVVSW
jgi:hypothetical protein